MATYQLFEYRNDCRTVVIRPFEGVSLRELRRFAKARAKLPYMNRVALFRRTRDAWKPITLALIAATLTLTPAHAQTHPLTDCQPEFVVTFEDHSRYAQCETGRPLGYDPDTGAWAPIPEIVAVAHAGWLTYSPAS